MLPLDLVLHFDGGVWPNPGGDPRYGWHLDTTDGRRVAESSGEMRGLPAEQRTNNTAEFAGLRAGLQWVAAFKLAPVDRLVVFGDSQLVVNIISGKWQAKKPHLQVMAEQVKAIVEGLDVGHFDIAWKRREGNAEADRLAGVTMPAAETRPPRPAAVQPPADEGEQPTLLDVAALQPGGQGVVVLTSAFLHAGETA